jgi:hypothetical protein
VKELLAGVGIAILLLAISAGSSCSWICNDFGRTNDCPASHKTKPHRALTPGEV